jgi:hypothetical protein
MIHAGIRSSFDIAALLPDQKVFVIYRPSGSMRGIHHPAWMVVNVGGPGTHPEELLLDPDNRTFFLNTMDKVAAMVTAQQWVVMVHGEREWVRDPWGAHHDGRVVNLVWEKVRANPLPKIRPAGVKLTKANRPQDVMSKARRLIRNMANSNFLMEHKTTFVRTWQKEARILLRDLDPRNNLDQSA